MVFVYPISEKGAFCIDSVGLRRTAAAQAERGRSFITQRM